MIYLAEPFAGILQTVAIESSCLNHQPVSALVELCVNNTDKYIEIKASSNKMRPFQNVPS